MPKSSFVEKNAIFIVIALIAIAGYGITKSKASLVDDCSKLNQIPAHVQYASTLSPSMSLVSGNGYGDYSRAISIDNVPEGARIASASGTLIFNGNSFGRPTQRSVGVNYGEFCRGVVIISYEGNPAIGWVASDGGTMDYTNLGGTYTLAYDIIFSDGVSSATPVSNPSIEPTSIPSPESTVIVNPYVCQDGTFVSDLSKCKKQDSSNVLILIGLAGAFITGFYIFKKQK